jgi:DUF4097 and DUF4098 domain-containing protein YvlB
MCSSCKCCPWLLLVGTAILVGCAVRISGFNNVTAQEEVQKSFQTSKTPRVVVEMFNGGIDIVCGVEEGKVAAKVTKRGAGATQEEAEDDLTNVKVQMVQEGDTVRILARRAEDKPNPGNSGASATVEVPTGAVLDLRSSNGALKVVGLTGNVTGKSSNGAIHVKGGRGTLQLTTSNGPITIEGASGKLDLNTSNGTITITGARAAELNAQTSNGRIRFSGTLADGEHVLHSSNGGLTVTLPADLHFRVDASTSNGHISSAFDVKAKGTRTKTHLRGAVGENPAVSLTLSTSNAGIEIKKAE